MNAKHCSVHFVTTLGLALVCLLAVPRATAAESTGALPAIIQNGLATYASAGAGPAFDTWRLGGTLETDQRPDVLSDRFARTVKPLGNHVSDDLIQTREISPSSKFVYLEMNFQRGVVYMGFLVFRGEKDWKVQNIEFNTKPDAVMPWLVMQSAK